jgi:hypothetical protein
MRKSFTKIKRYLPSKLKQFIKDEVRTDDRQESISYRIALTEKLNYSPRDIEYSIGLLNCVSDSKLKSIVWLIPGFKHPYGGIFTILRVGNYLKSIGYTNKFVIYDNPTFSVDNGFQIINRYFPKIDFEDFVTINSSVEQEVPESDIAIATYWTSCYPLLRIRNTQKKIYFIQDFEPLFNAAGTQYALCENTYRFPFHRIVNSKGLYDYIDSNYRIPAIKSMYFTPGVDDNYIYTQKPIDKIIRVFFYARPNDERNAFELGISFLKRIKEKYGDKVQIVCAGRSFAFKELGLEILSNNIVNMGILNYEDLPSFYSSFHIGISFMFTKHPSYIPLELMKSGCLVFTNINEANFWLLKDGYNCVLAYPSIDVMLDRFDSIANAPATYLNIIKNAYKTVRKFTWNSALDAISRFIIGL